MGDTDEGDEDAKAPTAGPCPSTRGGTPTSSAVVDRAFAAVARGGMGEALAAQKVQRGQSLVLETPALPLLVPARIFDGFSWGKSDALDVRLASPLDLDTPTLGRNPSGMAFVFTRDCDFLPRELARLHVGDLAADDEWALAPYAIDDATDELYARRAPPGELLCLAARSLDGLVWGLHDWCHFHNHGPFDEPAWTEVQCDASALVWLWQNRGILGLETARWEERRAQLEAVARRRFEAEGLPFETRAYEAERLVDLA